ncbi:MAG: phosphopantetheine-binding protein [Thermodesulfobacteriota bacterium]
MEEKLVMEKLLGLIEPFMDDPALLKKTTRDTHLIDDLNLNSAWLVDLIIKIEDLFDVEISDDDADAIQTVGNAVDVIRRKLVGRGSAAA